MSEFKIGDLVELKDEYIGTYGFFANRYYKITDISIDKSVVWVIAYSKDVSRLWSFHVRLETELLKHYKIKPERTSIYDKF